jgi:hypothetical protein
MSAPNLKDEPRRVAALALASDWLIHSFALSEIQKNARVFASAIGKIFVFFHDFKTAFPPLIDPLLSVAALAKIGRSTTRLAKSHVVLVG